MGDVERGRRMRELREAKGLLQRQVGAHFDIDKAAVSEWERGKSSPDRRRLVELDHLYEANGEVLALYDVGPADQALSDRVALLEEQVALLLSRHDEMASAVEQIAAALGRDLGRKFSQTAPPTA